MNCKKRNWLPRFRFRTAAFLLLLLCLTMSGCSALPVSLGADRSPYADLESSVYALKHWIQDARIPDEKAFSSLRKSKKL